MTLTQVTFETAPDGTAINSTNASTYGLLGGGSTSLGGGTITAKTVAALDGGRGIEIAAAASATTLTRAAFAGANQQGAFSQAFKLVTAPTGTTNIQIMAIRYAAGQVIRLNWDSATTKFRLNNAAGVAAPGTDYNTAATGTAYRIEFVVNTGSSTTTGSGTVNLYLLAGTTPIKTWTVASENLSGPNAITQVEIAASNGAVIYYDSIQTDDGRTTEIGRLAAPANAVPVVNITTSSIYQVAGSNVSLSGTITDSDGTIASATWQYMDDDENGAFTGSWTNLTTSLAGGGTASATATATDTSVPIGVRRYQLVGVDNVGGTGSATVDGYIYPGSATDVPVRYVINTGAYSNAGTTPASSLVAAMNDTSPNSGYNSWAESPAAPVGAVFTLVYEPHGPGPISLTVDLSVDVGSPNLTVNPVVKSVSGSTTVFTGTPITPTVTPTHYSVVLDGPGNTAATQAIRQALRLDLTATQ